MLGLTPLLASLGVAERFRKPLAHVALGLAVIALLGALWAFLSAREKADDKANQQIGAVAEQSRAAVETIKRVETGNAAREDIRAPGSDGDCVRYAQCVRSARPSAAANCARFLPDVSTGHGCPGPVAGR